MRILVGLLGMAGGLWGQLSLSVGGPPAVRQGSTATLTLTLGGSAANAPAGLQWTILPPSGVTFGAWVAGASTTAAGKSVTCDASGATCLDFGLNQNVIGAGVVASWPVTIPSNAPTGPSQFPLSGLIAVDKAGTAVALASGPTYSILILSQADLDGNGKVDAADVGLMLNQVLGTGGATCTSDQTGDGKCDLLDVYAVVLRALGL